MSHKIAKALKPELYSALRENSRAIGEKDDCSVIAVASACSVTYTEAHAALEKAGRKQGKATPISVTEEALRSLGFSAKMMLGREVRKNIDTYPHPHNHLKNVTTHHPRRFPEVWENYHPNMLWFTRDHVLSVKDGKVQDWSINNSLRVTQIWLVEKN